MRFAQLGDSAVLISVGTSVDRDVSGRVHALSGTVMTAGLPGVLDVVPAYLSLAVHFDPSVTDESTLVAALRDLMGSPVAPMETGEGRLVTIPVSYDGPDLGLVAEACGLPVEEVVARHSRVEYFVYMLGFAPGFAYLGDLDPSLRIPRRGSPRTRVPAGSVAIAGSQTAVYPHETPGGWQLIGTTAVEMFDAARNQPSLLRAGDRVKFEVA